MDERTVDIWMGKSLVVGEGVVVCGQLQRHTGLLGEVQRMGGESLDRRTGRLGGKAQGTKDLSLHHNVPKDGTTLHPSLKKWGDTDSPLATSAYSVQMRLLLPEAPKSPGSCPLLNQAPQMPSLSPSREHSESYPV